MSRIRITRNDAGNCVVFEGSTQSVFWNNCLTAQLNPADSDLVDVINTFRSIDPDTPSFEFNAVPTENWLNADGEAFDSGHEVVTYINELANVQGLSDFAESMVGTDIDFRLDATGTTVLTNKGYHWSVNSLKAVANNDGTIHLYAIAEADPLTGEASDREYLQGIEPGHAYINGTLIAGGISDVANALNELFTVGPFEAVVVSDPFSTMIADVDGDSATGVYAGRAVDPIGNDLATGISPAGYNHDGYKTVETITKGGEYYSFDIRGEGIIGLGLIDVNETAINYRDSDFGNATGNGHYGYKWSLWLHQSHDGPWTLYGKNPGYVQGPGWTSGTYGMRYNDEGASWASGDPIKVRVGINNSGQLHADYYDVSESVWRMMARSNYTVPDGSAYKLGVKFYGDTARLYSKPKIHLIEEDDTPTTIGDTAITLLGSATGTLAGGVTVSTASGLNDGIITTEALDAAGEYFQFEVSENHNHLVGLFSTNDYTVDSADAAADAGDWNEQDYFFFGGKIDTNEGFTNDLYKTGSGAVINTAELARDSAQTHFRVGFDTNGFATLWNSANGTDFTRAWTSYNAAPSGDYKLMWRGISNGAQLETVSTGVLAPVPTMYFRYIESPDGYYNFPLFATQEEADYYELIEAGADNGSHVHVYPDDPTNTQWYMPNTQHQMGYGLTPVEDGLTTFQGNQIVWTEITSLTNADLAPAAFPDQTVEVNELSAVNISVVPADAGWTTTVTDVNSSGLVLSQDGHLQGTAPEVTSDNVTNPADLYIHTITRTNSYGTSSGSLTVQVNNLTAPPTAITGFAHVAGSASLVDSDTLADGSVVSFDETVGEGQRFLITKQWVQDNVFPALQGTGDYVVVGLPIDGADSATWSSINPDSDFQSYIKWEYNTATSHTSTLSTVDSSDTLTINSMTDAYYDYAFELDSDDFHVIGCNVNAINTEPSVNNGGSFSRTLTKDGVSDPVTLNVASVSTQTDISLTGISELDIPLGPNDIVVVETSETAATFNGGATTSLTLTAGYTYTFMMDDASVESGDTLTFHLSDGTAYTTGVTSYKTPGEANSYVRFAVPVDVPPLHIRWNGNDQGVVNISGSTYSVGVTGITLEGPAANQTGTNVADNGDYGWLSADEPLAAGQRFVMSNAFFTDLLAEMDDQYEIRIGLKGDNWDNGDQSTESNTVTSGEVFKGDIQLRLYKSSGNNIYLQLLAVGQTGAQWLVNTVALHNTVCAFIEVTADGNNIRMGFGRNGLYGIAAGDESTKTYDDWGGSKMETGDQGFGITSLDVMFLVTDIYNGNNADYDGGNVDWTGLSEVSVPTPSVTNLTPWTKALDFSGGNEHAAQALSAATVNPLRMSDFATGISAPTTAGYTSYGSSVRPWATAIVFKIDGNASNQHIWNQGEGASTGDDNIYLRVAANKKLFFGWGREGSGYNECMIHPTPAAPNGFLGTQAWYGVYIAHTGERLLGSPTAADLADCFDIRLMNSAGNNWTIGSNLSVPAAWTSTGARMDRSITGDFTIGGRGGNRNFHGNVASMVVTTLRIGQPMPGDAEIRKMITDPVGWVDDYKIGVDFRPTHQGGDAGYGFIRGAEITGRATQVWLMGDGIVDSYANGIRNDIRTGDSTVNKLTLNSMVSNDIENVSIPGLS